MNKLLYLLPLLLIAGCGQTVPSSSSAVPIEDAQKNCRALMQTETSTIQMELDSCVMPEPRVEFFLFKICDKAGINIFEEKDFIKYLMVNAEDFNKRCSK